MKILIYRIGQLGDILASLPALWAVRHAYPDAHLTYLASAHPGSGFVEAQAVLPAEGLIDSWLTYSVEDIGGARGLFRFWRLLRSQKFDLLVYLSPRLRPRRSIWRDVLFFRSAGIRRMVGHKGFPPLPRRKPGKPLPAAEHEVDHLLGRLAHSQIPVPPPGQREIHLDLTAKEKQIADDWLHAHVPGYPDGVALVGIGPGSKWPSKIWPEERFAALGRALWEQLALFPIVFGGPGDSPLASRLLKQWGHGASAAGELAVRPAAAALARCRLFVGNDTGTMHLAAAVRTPCVGIFAALDWPGRWYPNGPGHIVLRRAVSCEGCLLSVCSTEGMRCLKEIYVEDVFEACRKILGAPIPAR
jgi:ADP-heptose:LPS heptosyltransferase